MLLVSDVVRATRANPQGGCGVEMDLCANTAFFHNVTCYIDDATARTMVRCDWFVYGKSIREIVAKHFMVIKAYAPCKVHLDSMGNDRFNN